MSRATQGAKRRRTGRAARQGGFNIVELMVAIGIGGLLLTGAVSLFVNNRATSQTTQDLSRLQENGRFALQTIVSHLRMAGHFGCANDISRLEVHQNIRDLGPTGELWFPAGPLEGIDDYVSGDPNWLPTDFDASELNVLTVAPNTDAITIRYLQTRLPDHRVADHSGRVLTVNQATGVDDGDVLGVVDCGAGDIIRACHGSIDGCGGGAVADADSDILAGGEAITVQGDLSRAYDPDVNPVAVPMFGVRFFVATNEFGNPALFRTRYRTEADGSLGEVNDEIFEGVADLQFLYGVDTDNDDLPNSFVPADNGILSTNANAWLNVVAVKVGVLVVTPQGRGEILEQVLPDLLDKSLGTVTDSFRRRVFTTTVQLRNL